MKSQYSYTCTNFNDSSQGTHIIFRSLSVESGTRSEALQPTLKIKPENKYNCQIELTLDINNKLIPNNIAHPLITILGPNLSLRIPVTMAKEPFIRLAIEAAPDNVVLVQMNSVDNEVKNTLKVFQIPTVTN